MMKFYILIFLFGGLVASCQSQNDGSSEPPTVKVENDDSQMNEAIKAATATLPQFKAALQSNNQNLENFALKVRFDLDHEGGEHIWVNSLSLKNNKFYGVIGNEPEFTKEIKMGDKIEIDPKRITDWMYVDQGKLKGGYTIRVLRNKMQGEERANFDKEIGFVIED
jgi:uncharacterized protein YegJ (DUF2314 family)